MSEPLSAKSDRLDTVFLSCQLVTAGALLAFLIGSLLFTGGQVAPSGNRIWGELWSWPVFPVPPWVTIIPAALGALVVLPVAVAMVRVDSGMLVGRWGQTVPALLGATLFDRMFPVASGTTWLKSHAFAVALSGFSYAVLTVAILVLLVREHRSRRGIKASPEPLESTPRLLLGIVMTIACGAMVAVFVWGSIQGWLSIAAEADGGGSARRRRNAPSVAGTIFLSLMTIPVLIMTVAVAQYVVRQVAARRRFPVTTTS